MFVFKKPQQESFNKVGVKGSIFPISELTPAFNLLAQRTDNVMMTPHTVF